MLECLVNSNGIVTVACHNAGISRKTHYDWLNSDSTYFAQVEDIQNVAIDFVESMLFKNIQQGREASIIFFLKTRAKHRGYSENVEQFKAEDEIILPDIPELESFDDFEEIAETPDIDEIDDSDI